jgi:uncharacterized protein YbjT (DUF2867 family)
MYVVAGVTGHVGSVVANELLSQGKKIRVIVRDPAKGAHFAKRGAELAVGSLGDEAFLTRALTGAEGAFLLLPPDYAAADFRAAQRKAVDVAAAAVKASKVPHVVLLSSIGADQEGGTGPIVGLYYYERKLRETGIKLTALRAGYFQENVATSLGAAKAQGIYPSFAPEQAPMPMVATKDIGAEATRLLLTPPAKSTIVDIAGPSYTAVQVAELLGKKLGKPLTVVAIPEPGWVGALTGAGLSQQIAELYAEMYSAFMKGLCVPKGDRMVQGATTLDATIAELD